MNEIRYINLPKGNTLEVTVHPGFYDKIRKQLGLSADQAVEDDHIRMFIFGALGSAVDKVEKDVSNVTEEARNNT